MNALPQKQIPFRDPKDVVACVNRAYAERLKKDMNTTRRGQSLFRPMAARNKNRGVEEIVSSIPKIDISGLA